MALALSAGGLAKVAVTTWPWNRGAVGSWAETSVDANTTVVLTSATTARTESGVDPLMAGMRT